MIGIDLSDLMVQLLQRESISDILDALQAAVDDRAAEDEQYSCAGRLCAAQAAIEAARAAVEQLGL